MIKKFFLSLALLAGLLSPAYSAGTISLSLSQQFDSLGKPLNGGRLYFIQAGTTSTPQNAYQDSALTIPHPNPLTLDSAGRVPQLFFADGQIKIRLTTASGVNQIVADNIMVVGASSGGGGGGTVDPTTIIATGDIKARYGTGVLSGFVRANGRTVGSSTSGATERANADCQALFEYLWGADANLAVSTGRGASANADWVANKTITLPDWRGRSIVGLDDMGNSASGTLTSTYYANPTTLGSFGGGQIQVLGTTNLPPYTPSGSVSGTISGTGLFGQVTNSSGSGSVLIPSWVGGNADGRTLPVGGTFSGTLTGTAQGGTSAAFSILNPSRLATIYMKL